MLLLEMSHYVHRFDKTCVHAIVIGTMSLQAGKLDWTHGIYFLIVRPLLLHYLVLHSAGGTALGVVRVLM